MASEFEEKTEDEAFDRMASLVESKTPMLVVFVEGTALRIANCGLNYDQLFDAHVAMRKCLTGLVAEDREFAAIAVKRLVEGTY